MTTTDRGADFTIGFKRHLRAHVVRGEAVYLLSERGATSVRGASIEALAPLLDGTRDLAALRRDVPAGIAPSEAGTIVMRLVDAGLVTLRTPMEPELTAEPPTLAYWEAAGLDPARAVHRTTGTTIQTIAIGEVDVASALPVFAAAGLTTTESPADRLADDADLSIVLCEDYLDSQLAHVDAMHRAAGRPWLLAKPGGTQLWLGPVFEPVEETACWHCLAHWLRGHRLAETRLRSMVGERAPLTPPAVSLPPLGAAALQLIALETVKWAAGLRHGGQHSVWTLDSLDLQGRHHELRRRPQCGSCGDATILRRQAWQPVVVEHRRKTSRSGGGHRSMTPDAVLRAHEHLISPITGVLKEITQDNRGPSFFNSFRAGPNLALSTARRFEQMTTSLRAENGGKGVTALHGKVSALCEAIERHCGYFHGDEERVPGSYTGLADHAEHPAIHPADCLLFDERQNVGREEWNAQHSTFQYVPPPFDEDAVISWTPVWSLTESRHRLLPTGMLYFDVPAKIAGGAVCADSNGNAAGASLEDALLQGLLEVIERDSVALWWYNRTQAPAVDMDSFGDPWVDEMRETYAGLNREVWVLDLTSDIGVPTMAALSRRTDKPCEDIMFGFGAHLDPKVAFTRALTELNQLMPAVVDIDRDGAYGWTDPDALRWWQTATWAGTSFVRPDPAVAVRHRDDYGYSPTTDLHDDVTSVQRSLESAGLDVLVLNQTRPDVGLPVVKAIVPGMRGFWSRLGAGRLFDAPVTMGRLARPTEYAALNPIPLFL